MASASGDAAEEVNKPQRFINRCHEHNNTILEVISNLETANEDLKKKIKETAAEVKKMKRDLLRAEETKVELSSELKALDLELEQYKEIETSYCTLLEKQKKKLSKLKSEKAELEIADSDSWIPSNFKTDFRDLVQKMKHFTTISTKTPNLDKEIEELEEKEKVQRLEIEQLENDISQLMKTLSENGFGALLMDDRNLATEVLKENATVYKKDILRLAQELKDCDFDVD